VEQFGLATMPFGRRSSASGLTSATTSGTSGSRRKAEELSTTTAPAAANFGANSFDTSAPAENSAMSTPAGSKPASSCTSTSSSPNATRSPAERALASATTSAGKRRSASTASIASPTAPVAPTTATFNFLPMVLRTSISCRSGAHAAIPLHCGSGGSRDALPGNPRGHLAHVPALRPVAQRLVHQHQRQHRLADGGRAHADARVVASGGHHLDLVAAHVHAARRQAQAGGRLERHRHHDLLAAGDAAEDAAGMVAEEALRGRFVAVQAAALHDAGEAIADLDALGGVDGHHR